MEGPLERGLRARRQELGSLWAVLLDPDSVSTVELESCAAEVEEAGADLLLVGGSSTRPDVFARGMAAVRSVTSLPVVIFPGSHHQVVEGAHAILFTSLFSGRNPHFLAEEQVLGAPRVKALGMEALPTAYLLIESGVPTTVQKVSGTCPLDPSDAPRVVDHVLAASLMGMRWAYLEAGSGAQRPVAVGLVARVADEVPGIDLLVGGGLRDPDAMEARAKAGASIVVTGNVLEMGRDKGMLRAMARAVHHRVD